MSHRGSKKKENIQNLTAKMMGTSGPAVKVWSHEGFILTSKIATDHLLRPKRMCPMRLQNCFQGQMKGFSWCQRYKYPKSIAKLNPSYQVWSHGGFTLKKRTLNRHFPRPAETDPYVSKHLNAALPKYLIHHDSHQAVLHKHT